MALFSYEALKTKYDLNQQIYDKLFEQAKNESINMRDNHTEFDIFLSHSYKDKEVIPYLKKELENMGYSVYVDWINDRFLSRNEVTKETAKILQTRMRQSKSLFFATSENSSDSKWMPWELGYFDGMKDKRVAILPIQMNGNFSNNKFEGQEYLGLYYYVTIDKLSRDLEHKVMAMESNALEEMRAKFNTINKLFINEENSKFVVFEEWIDGENPYSFYDESNKIINEVNKRN